VARDACSDREPDGSGPDERVAPDPLGSSRGANAPVDTRRGGGSGGSGCGGTPHAFAVVRNSERDACACFPRPRKAVH